MSWALFVN